MDPFENSDARGDAATVTVSGRQVLFSPMYGRRCAFQFRIVFPGIVHQLSGRIARMLLCRYSNLWKNSNPPAGFDYTIITEV